VRISDLRPPIEQLGEKAGVSGIQERPIAVLVGDVGHSRRPFYRQHWIVVSQAPLRCWSVGGSREISDFSVIMQGLEAVGEALGHIKHISISSRQGETGILHECEGRGSQVDYDVVNGALDASDELVFSVRGDLEMHAPYCPGVLGARGVLLNEIRVEAVGAKLRFAHRPSKEASIVAAQLRSDQFGIRKFGGLENHKFYSFVWTISAPKNLWFCSA
jgi:hypothetical protein